MCTDYSVVGSGSVRWMRQTCLVQPRPLVYRRERIVLRSLPEIHLPFGIRQMSFQVEPYITLESSLSDATLILHRNLVFIQI